MWSGSWEGGSIDVPGISSHSLFFLSVSSYNGSSVGTDRLVGFRLPGSQTISALSIPVWDSDSASSTALIGAAMSVSGDTLRDPRFTKVNAENGYVYEFRGVTEIYALL